MKRKFFDNELENHRFNKKVDAVFIEDPEGTVEDFKFINNLIENNESGKLEIYINKMEKGFIIAKDKISFVRKSLIKKNIKFVIDEEKYKLYIPSLKQFAENEEYIKLLVENAR